MGADNTPEKRKKSRHPPLKTIGDVKKELARVFWAARSGTADVGDCSKMANILSLLGRLISDHDLEARITKLEQEGQNGKANW